ncbi:MAG TPA: amidohydrolase family protein [Xanthobacteraceae bacterium]|nr:amidohydrolase family protein [Xanthobacteraceae bacterium]
MNDLSALRLLDVHHHVVLSEYEAALVRSGAADPSRPLRRRVTPQQALDAMAELGIAAAVLNPLSAAGVHHGSDAHARYLTQTTNEALAQFASHAPDRLGFFAALPLPDLDGALHELAVALDELHADGVILLTSQNGWYVGDPAFDALYAELDRRGAVVFVHPASPAYVATLRLDLWAAYVEYPFETTRVAANLIYHGITSRYPGIKWILAHGGGVLPYLSVRLRLMEESDKNAPPFSERVPEGVAPHIRAFWFDVALVGGAAPMAALTEIADPARILYGSDWPYLQREFVRDQLADLMRLPQFAGDRRAALAWRNAAGLFPRLAVNVRAGQS